MKIRIADATTLFCNLDNIPESNIQIVLNSELDNISCWLAYNKLSLNVNKTKYIVFHTNRRKCSYPNLTTNNVVVNSNFLGLLNILMC